MFLRVLTIAVSIIATVASDDPCEGEAAFCGVSGTCFHDGAFGCNCNPGYENSNGDRKTCTNIDECEQGLSNCASENNGGYCVDTDPTDASTPRWKCGCSREKGYADGNEVDPNHGPLNCVLGCNESCGSNARCSFNSSDETYFCVCDEGYESDGNGECLSSQNLRAPSAMPSTTSRPSQTLVDDIPPLACYETEVMTMIYTGNFTSDDAEWNNAKYSSSAELGRYMGSFKKGDAFPSRKFTIPPGLTRVIISFDAIELDSWDGDGITNGPDELSITINSIVATTEVGLGAFHHQITEETIEGGDSTFSYSIRTTSNRESLGGLEQFKDQTHHVTVVLGHTKFSPLGEELDVTIGFIFGGDIDESLGIDNVEVKSCLTTLMTPGPTPNPTQNPTPAPVNPTRPPRPPPVPAPTRGKVGKTSKCTDACIYCGPGECFSDPGQIIPFQQYAFWSCQQLQDWAVRTCIPASSDDCRTAVTLLPSLGYCGCKSTGC